MVFIEFFNYPKPKVNLELFVFLTAYFSDQMVVLFTQHKLASDALIFDDQPNIQDKVQDHVINSYNVI